MTKTACGCAPTQSRESSHSQDISATSLVDSCGHYNNGSQRYLAGGVSSVPKPIPPDVIKTITSSLYAGKSCQAWLPSVLMANTDFINCPNSKWGGGGPFTEAFIAAARYTSTALLFLNYFVVSSKKEYLWGLYGDNSIEAHYGPYSLDKYLTLRGHMSAFVTAFRYAKTRYSYPIRFTCHWEDTMYWPANSPSYCKEKKPYDPTCDQVHKEKWADISGPCSSIVGSTMKYGGYWVTHFCYKWPEKDFQLRWSNIVHELTHSAVGIGHDLSTPLVSWILDFRAALDNGFCYPLKCIPGIDLKCPFP